MKYLTALSLVVCGCMFAWKGGHTSLVTASPAEMLESVVLLDSGTGTCSGFLYGDNYVITSAHCVRSLWIRMDTGKSSHIAFLVKGDTSVDLAIFKYSKCDHCVPAQLAFVEPRPGDRAYLAGAPLGISGTITSGSVSKTSQKSWIETPMMMLDITGWYGNSGGPVYNTDGRVIGVLSQLGPQCVDNNGDKSPKTGWMFATKLSDIKKFLEDVPNAD